MNGEETGSHRSTWRLILYPALITLAITILRLAGELLHGSKSLFNPEPGGPWSIIGIVWLAPVFGVYFAVKLARAGVGPASPWKAIGVALAGSAMILASNAWGGRIVASYGYKAVLLFFWTAWALAGLLQFIGWPRFFKILLSYSFAARIPVALIMFFAFWGHWGTHYDALPPGWKTGGYLSDYIWMGFFPQLTLWVGYTLVAGALFGSITAGVMLFFRRISKPAAA